MTKKLTFGLILSLGLATTAIAQQGRVGINTTNPAATFDVVAKNTDPAIVDGVIAPRLTGDELKAKDGVYLGPQTGAIVYATAGVTGTPAGKTIKVTSPGYYYFDGLVWVRIANAAEAIGAVKAIYNLVGTTTQTVPVNATVDVAGLSQTITVPAGKSSILQITATGYAAPTNTASVQASQGAFGIVVDGVKVTSGYVSSSDSNGANIPSAGLALSQVLVRLPSPTTITTLVTLAPGTHTIKVNFKAWFAQQQINVNAFTAFYGGADSGDADALKARLTIIEFNN